MKVYPFEFVVQLGEWMERKLHRDLRYSLGWGVLYSIACLTIFALWGLALRAVGLL